MKKVNLSCAKDSQQLGFRVRGFGSRQVFTSEGDGEDGDSLI